MRRAPRSVWPRSGSGLQLETSAFFSGLTPEQQKVVREATKIASDIHRNMTSDQDLAAKQILAEKGMQVTEVSTADLDAFRKLAQPPVIAWANQEIGKEHTERLLAAVKAARQ